MDEAAKIVRETQPEDSKLLVGRIGFQVTGAILQLESDERLTVALKAAEGVFQALAVELAFQRLHPSTASLWLLKQARDKALNTLLEIEDLMSQVPRHNGPVFKKR